jgi:hypothetical protein
LAVALPVPRGDGGARFQLAFARERVLPFDETDSRNR